MACYNPFGTIGKEDSTEVLFPGVPSLNNIQTHPPRTFEMNPMRINPVTGDSYVPTPGDRLNPSDHKQWGNFTTANTPTNMQLNGLLQHYVGEPSGPSAPMLHPSPHSQSQIYAAQFIRESQPIYPHLRSAEETNVYCTNGKQDSMVSTENSGNASCTHYNQPDQVNSEEIVRVYSHSERYKNKVDQAKNELSNYFNDLHHKLNDHHYNLVQQLNSRYERNVSIIEQKQQEIKNRDEFASSILKNEANSKSSEELKKFVTEQKQVIETDVILLTQIEICYKPELLGDLREVVTLVTGQTEDGMQPLTSEVKVKDSRTQPTREVVQTDSEIRSDPESPRLAHHTITLPPRPIIHNVPLNHGISSIQDPTGLAVDRKNNDVIYVADKDKHRVQVFDRSGNYVKTIVHGEEMRYPHSLAVSNEYLFVLCAANKHEHQYVLRFQKKQAKDIRKLFLKDIRHIPLCVHEESLYIATYDHTVELFDMDLTQKGKIEIKLERKSSVKSLFSNGPEIRDICIRNRMLYLLVLNSDHAIQKFSLDGDLVCLLAPVGELNDPRYFTVDNWASVFVTEGREGRIKLFKSNGKLEEFAYVDMEGRSEKITKPMGIDVDSKGKVVLCCAQKDWVLKEL